VIYGNLSKACGLVGLSFFCDTTWQVWDIGTKWMEQKKKRTVGFDLLADMRRQAALLRSQERERKCAARREGKFTGSDLKSRKSVSKKSKRKKLILESL